MRADQLLLARGLVPTRSAARRAIGGGAVERLAAHGWTRCAKAGEELDDATPMRIVDEAELRWASRGGLKLDAALAQAGIDVTGSICLDAGQSTGGFTDVLLARGAARVVGFDVGHGQLHARLRGDPRVTALEGLHVRELAGSALAAHAPPQGFDLLVADLSFISLAGALPHLAPWLRPGGDALLLAKPQFEVGREQVGKGGVVRDDALRAWAVESVRGAAEALGWREVARADSRVAGPKGNREIFLHLRNSES